MKFLKFIKSNLLFSLIIFFLVIVPLTVIPIYFAINKSSSSSSEQGPFQEQVPNYTMDPNGLGFIANNTINGVDYPKWFLPIYLSEINCVNADNSTPYTLNTIQSKWIYDKNNEYSIERTILNTNNSYSQEELSALGKTTKPNTYLVNQIIFLYDKNNINLSQNVEMTIKPMILTKYSNYEKLYK
jgi:hypothetical protein